MNPTKEQRAILDSDRNLVIVASPGSGKTFVLAEKIKLLLPDLLEYKGVIAISYTNKSSQELQARCLKDGISPKSSFFGTIDKFYLSELLIPFGKQLFGIPKNEIKIVRLTDLDEDISNKVSKYLEIGGMLNVVNELPIDLITLFQEGIVVLDTVGMMSLHVFDRSKACKSYIKARYSHIFIDEYQDCGREQHQLFLRICDLGLTGVAVGDANQSIFQFSGKSSAFLLDLARNSEKFDLYPLDFNHRSHPSIVNYSLLLLNARAQMLDYGELRVCEKKVNGDEIAVARWISKMIPKLCDRLNISNLSKIGILVRGNVGGSRIAENLGIPCKLSETTVLDEDFTIWSEIFRQLLTLNFDRRRSRSDFLAGYIDLAFQKRKAKDILTLIDRLAMVISSEPHDIDATMLLMEKIAFELNPLGYSQKSLGFLRNVLANSRLLNSYRPATSEEVQIMTLHKSKGLEFDVVFHLDLYKFILPNQQGDQVQDLNLHYVGITRAKECCILVHSTHRTRSSNNQVIQAEPSDFLVIEYLIPFRSLF